MTAPILNDDFAAFFEETAAENAAAAKREDACPAYQAGMASKRADAMRREIAAGLRSQDGEWIDPPTDSDADSDADD